MRTKSVTTIETIQEGTSSIQIDSQLKLKQNKLENEQ